MLESNKRKADNEEVDDEPPPIPPRKRAPPEKPPRRLENTETTAAEESLKQKKLVKNLRGRLSFVILEYIPAEFACYFTLIHHHNLNHYNHSLTDDFVASKQIIGIFVIA